MRTAYCTANLRVTGSCSTGIDATFGRSITIGDEPDTTREFIIERTRDPSHHHDTKMRTTSTTHLGWHLDRTTLILTLIGVALLGLLALLQR